MDTHADLEGGLHQSSRLQPPLSRPLTPSVPSTVSVDKTISNVLPVHGPISQRAGRLTRALRFYRHNYTVYRRIFTVVFTVNLSILIASSVSASGLQLAMSASNAAAVNLAVGVLFRQEQVINSLFSILTSIPCSWPLWIRVQVAQIFHYGGFHSGCGVAAACWFLLYTALATRDYVASSPSASTIESIATAWILVGLFALLLAGAYPAFRFRYHNHFEIFHRFSGWSALAVFWAHVLFSSHGISKSTDVPMGLALARSVPFWCILLATLPVIGSWVQLRRREVHVEALSDHATRLSFNYTEIEPCYGIRVSTTPLLEWHSFATIPDVESDQHSHFARPQTEPLSPIGNSSRGFSVVISNAGDWTSRVIRSPPSHLWVRGSPLRGVILSARLFSRVVIVATGSGIGPCLSLLVAHTKMLPAQPRVIWSAPSPATTFGERILREVREADADAIIWDTKARGRPNLCTLAEEAGRQVNAEAVFIISNPKVCKMMVNGLRDRGIPAFAPIFDS